MLDIKAIKERYDLLKQVTLQDNILIADLAKEMKERVTDLMLFINNNPKLFHTDSVWTYKNEISYTYIFGEKCKDTNRVKDKCKGLGITAVFLSPEENYETEEWVNKKIEDNKKTLWLSEWNNYGTIEGLYLRGEEKNDKFKAHLWRNTEEKINSLKKEGILYDTTFYIGGFMDCSSHKVYTAITKEGIEKARSLGWNIITPEKEN